MAAMFAGVWCMLQIFTGLSNSGGLQPMQDNAVMANALSNDEFMRDYIFDDVNSWDLLDEMMEDGSLDSDSAWDAFFSEDTPAGQTETVSAEYHITPISITMIFSCPLRVLAAVLISMASLSVFAQAPGPKDIDRDRFLSEIRNYKHEVLVKSLELTKEQQREFFPIYDELDNRLQEINTETRELEKRVAVDQTATDTEIEAAASMVYSQKTARRQS